MNIVLDSNTIISDFHLEGSGFAALKAFLERTDAKLLIPTIVLDEVVNKFKESLASAQSRAQEGIRDVDRLTKRKTCTGISIDIDTETTSYRERLTRKLNGVGTQYLGYPNTSHENVVARDLDRRKPFDSSGKGYRDALIWDSLLARVRENPTQTVFVTNNTRDFAAQDKEHLHLDLVNDLRSNGLPEDLVVLAPSLGAFISVYVEPKLKRLDRVMHALQEDSFAGLHLTQVLLDRKETVAEQITDELPALLEVSEFENPEVDYLEDPIDIHVVDVYELTPEDLFVRFTASFDASVTFFIFKPDYFALDEEKVDFEIWDDDWSRHYMWGSTFARLEVVFSLTFDEGSQSVESFGIEYVHGLRGPRGRIY